MIESLWDQLARRLVDALGAQRGELIEVRDEAGNQRLLHAVLLALESVGAEPLVSILPAQQVERLLVTASPDTLATRGRRYAEWLHQVDRSLLLVGAYPNMSQMTDEALHAFGTAYNRLEQIRATRRIPQIIAAIPTIGKAAQLGLSHEDLELRMMPALLVSSNELQTITDQLVPVLNRTSTITTSTGPGYELHLRRDDRLWLCDTGRIAVPVGEADPIISYLPSGSVYTTVIAESAEGDLFLPVAGPARAAHLHLNGGRVTQIEAASGAERLLELFDRYESTARRIRYIGIGLNPRLSQPLGWPMVDQHVQGTLRITFGENRYHGGANAVPYQLDFVIGAANLRVDDQLIIDQGRLVVNPLSTVIQ
jgi:leucyl aminopeptidase (aminopeptidase T)